MEGKILNGRKLTVSIAADNRRASEFIKKRVYKDKSRCYECGDEEQAKLMMSLLRPGYELDKLLILGNASMNIIISSPVKIFAR
ncbi:unnamed protein product [Arabis nemorensis]|uniref:Uncharacterized protein n=1 Tax=Arabis nemorensis TaxID=586526 RepID=A0A565B6W1_9BRAS|nr:unnamed protein product [Arabis nemorensis]